MSHDYLIIKVRQGLEKIILDPNFFIIIPFMLCFSGAISSLILLIKF